MAASEVAMGLQSFANSYILTTRSQPVATTKSQTFPLPNGALWWYTAPNQYDPEVTAYTPVGSQPGPSPPQSFLTMIESDLQIAIANGFPQLTVVIHGLANLFADSISEQATLGGGLQQYAQYHGLVISFDWPSYDEIESFLPSNYAPLPYRFPPSTTSGTIRGNVNGSVQAFGTMVAMLAIASAETRRGDQHHLPFRGDLHDDAGHACAAQCPAAHSEPGTARRR